MDAQRLANLPPFRRWAFQVTEPWCKEGTSAERRSGFGGKALGVLTLVFLDVIYGFIIYYGFLLVFHIVSYVFLLMRYRLHLFGNMALL